MCRRLALLMTALFSLPALAFNMWEIGELNYAGGESEISSFVNTDSGMQLQTVMCTRGLPYAYRFTLLLPAAAPSNMVIQARFMTDGLDTSAYGEVQGNAIDFQIDESLINDLADSSRLVIRFESSDAEYLSLPEELEIPMTAADFSLRRVSAECTVRAFTEDWRTSERLISTILWPRDLFGNSKIAEDLTAVCVAPAPNGSRRFNLTARCKMALDRFYASDGIGPLSFLYELFNGEDSLYRIYERSWNAAVEALPSGPIRQDAYADGSEWYLLLYSLVSDYHVSSFSNSFYEIRRALTDATTLVYDIDNRYELEALKYSSVLLRRVQGNLRSQEAVTRALKDWGEFYRRLQLLLPRINQAQSIRPLVYRTMLMRLWHLAGQPRGIRLDPQNEFVQGTGHKTVTDEYLERKCSFFDGANGEEFYFASVSCLKGIFAGLRAEGLKTEDFQELENSWTAFARAWSESKFFTDSIDDAVGEDLRSNLGLALLSMFRTYGFGDYFLMRQCISSRDSDICGFESAKAYDTYVQELSNRLSSIAGVSPQDAGRLKELSNLWENYYSRLSAYVEDLSARGRLPSWRAGLVKGTAAATQTNALLSFPYDREELPDETLDFNVD